MPEHVEKDDIQKRLMIGDDYVSLFLVKLFPAVNYYFPERTHLCEHYTLDDHPPVVHQPAAVKGKRQQPEYDRDGKGKQHEGDA